MRAEATQSINSLQQRTGNRWKDNAFLYAAYQTMAGILGAQSADGVQSELETWRGDRRGTTALVRVDGGGFGGTVHGRVKVAFTTKSRTFVPDVSPPSGKARSRGASSSQPIDDPLTYAASQTVADLAGAQASAAAKYQLVDWTGNLSGVTGKVRVDVDTDTGSFHGVVNVVLEKKEASYTPDAEPAATFTKSGR